MAQKGIVAGQKEVRGYLTQDPIGLAGNNPTLYGYVHDSNSWTDLFGLDPIFLDPKDINFSQTSVNKNFDTPDGKINIDKFAKQVKEANLPNGGNTIMENMKPIRVVNVKGQLVVRDGNSRLYTAIKGKSKIIPIEFVTDIDELREFNSRLKRNGLPNTGTSDLPKCK
ncbi:hypothetical protein JJC03_04650 [Flavobacterium oreochromis]|uniref:hypothetical protein n=1 Tax=Flavobacterium oreochromis TaxID=2906078 RepID=UPI001CE4FD08|nr:hypothetical protein [Flavobacterium oreochromis]QYS87231.1 hypothetical protein JJC03_04650 [Flavobacterium oreochromis]